MQFAVLYRWRSVVNDDGMRETRRLWLAWEPPEGLEIVCHYHFARGGGVVIVETADASTLHSAIAAFTPNIEFELEPVVNIIQATARAMDVDDWARSVHEQTDNS